MNVDNIQAQMRKGILEYCLLSILSRQDAYASEIISELKNARMIVVEGTLYPILTRLKNQELLSYRWEESPQGPTRKYYTITSRGREALALLDAPRQIGLGLTDSCILTPRKSVTAILGLAVRPQTKRFRGCAHCSMFETCSYRKAGKTCGR